MLGRLTRLQNSRVVLPQAFRTKQKSRVPLKTHLQFSLLPSKPDMAVVISIILPVYNAEAWLDDAFGSIFEQTFIQQGCQLEVSVYDDASSDKSLEKISEWQKKFDVHSNVKFLVTENVAARKAIEANDVPIRGIGRACNEAIRRSTGDFLCRFDADDIMHPRRLELLWQAAKQQGGAVNRTLIGSSFVRLPADATPRYAAWLNTLSQPQLMNQRFREVTLLHPTWFFHRSIWEGVGGYVEDSSLPEDLIFFYRHIEAGGLLFREPTPLLTYRFLFSQRSWKVHRLTLLRARVEHFEKQVLRTIECPLHPHQHQNACKTEDSKAPDQEDCKAPDQEDCKAPDQEASKAVVAGSLASTNDSLGEEAVRIVAAEPPCFPDLVREVSGELKQHAVVWDRFSIWGAGRDGKAFFKALSQKGRDRVTDFWDVDPKKIGVPYVDPVTKRKIPVRHRDEMRPPIVVCVAQSRSNGLEEEMRSLNLHEGRDFFYLV